IAKKKNEKPVKVLNLFSYTGVASLFALRAGAEVTHLDASKNILKWAKENEKLNNLDIGCPSGHPMSKLRIIEDDVIKFLEREEKRGNKYDAVIMDPPKFGRGPKGEVWEIEKDLPKLLVQVKKVLNNKPLFVILTSYAIGTSSLSLGHALADTMKSFKGNVEQGELCVLEKSNGKLIPLANTALWISSSNTN
ncbi:MAG: class I SAM-dependent methyltransferase, partial [Patescibacteria group bacterium]